MPIRNPWRPSRMKHSIKTILKAAIPHSSQPTRRLIFKRLLYFGFRYKCPLCNSHLRKFLPYGLDLPVLTENHIIGAGYRQNALCPVCGSLDRERLVYIYLRRKTNIFCQSVKLLHIAPEPMLQSMLQTHSHIRYFTADLYSDAVTTQMDITNIPCSSNSLDVIICNHVLEHIADDRMAMSELFRILRPSGWAILQVPISIVLETTYEDFSITAASEREKAFGQADHVRIYGKDFTQKLEQVGFVSNVFDWRIEKRHFGGPTNRFALVKNESLYLAVKPE